MTLQLADEIDLDEVEAAKLLLESEDDQVTLGRSLLECGIIRFHQQRKYLLDCMRLCINVADEDADPQDQDWQTGLADYAARNIFGAAAPGEAAAAPDKKFVPRCMAAMQDARLWLQKWADRVAVAGSMRPWR